MTININKEGSKLTVSVAGRLDTTTSPDLEKALDEAFGSTTELVFDFKDLEYISSSGLRVLLKAQKKMNRVGTMKVCHINDLIAEVFEVTGFVDILTIE